MPLPEGTFGGAAPLEAVVVRPASAPGPLPAVLLPHGGPHAAYTRSYMLPTAFLPALGYAVIAVCPPSPRPSHLPRHTTWRAFNSLISEMPALRDNSERR